MYEAKNAPAPNEMPMKRNNKIFTFLLDLLFPPRCALCGALVDSSSTPLCPRCEKGLPEREEPNVLLHGPYGKCAAALYYEDNAREAILGLKFQGRRAPVPILARYMAQAAAEHLAGEFDAVTFVPVSRKRLRKRGYDQSRLLAHALAEIWDTQEVSTLEKIRDNPAQSSLRAPEERRANVLGVYRAPNPGLVEGRRWLLVDDVVTTGSTLAACADTLRRAGAAGVVCCCAASPREKEKKPK